MTANELEIDIWYVPVELSDDGCDIAVFADALDPDDSNTLIFREAAFVREADFRGCKKRLMKLPPVVDLIERVAAVAGAEYEVRHNPSADDGLDP